MSYGRNVIATPTAHGIGPACGLLAVSDFVNQCAFPSGTACKLAALQER
jgi:hypothetical protein